MAAYVHHMLVYKQTHTHTHTHDIPKHKKENTVFCYFHTFLLYFILYILYTYIVTTYLSGSWQ